MNFYRFSISWPRVLANGEITTVNEDGIAYYSKLIDRLLEENIQPMITLYHWDLPQYLQQLGGWTNEIIIEHFEAYANLMFQRLGDRVKHWITINEPAVFCLEGYGEGDVAPLVQARGVGEYLCSTNVLKAHAVVYHLYKRLYAAQFNGKVGIAYSTKFAFSDTNNTAHVNRAVDFDV